MNESSIKCEPSNQLVESTNQEPRANITAQSSSEDLKESKTNIKSDTRLTKSKNIPNTSVSLEAKVNVKAEAGSNNNFEISPENRSIAETEAAAHKAAMESLVKFGRHPYHPASDPFYYEQPHKDSKFNQLSHGPNFFNPNLLKANGNNSANSRDIEMIKFTVRINIIEELSYSDFVFTKRSVI